MTDGTFLSVCLIIQAIKSCVASTCIIMRRTCFVMGRGVTDDYVMWLVLFQRVKMGPRGEINEAIRLTSSDI